MQTAVRPVSQPPVNVTWNAILDGSLRFLEIVRSDATCRVVVCDESAPARARLGSRERIVLRRFAEGDEQKVIAYDLGIGPGTVCGYLRAALEKLGVATWQQAVLAAALFERTDSTLHAIEDDNGDAPGPHRMLRAELCPNALRCLTPTEREIALRVVDGCSTQEIAEERSASPRTVANQLASISEKLGTHGRQALIRRLALPALSVEGRCPGLSSANSLDEQIP